MIRYIHGSGDSTDVDVHYVFDEMPNFQTCKAFADEDKTENRNIITIENGIVTHCYKGTIDEINNGLLDTYSLHHQEYPLLVTRRVERNIEIKFIRAIRGILSHLSRCQYRSSIKQALRSNWTSRITTLNDIDFSSIDFSSLNKNNNLSELDIKKVIAFQIGQCLGLINGKEFYSKDSIANEYPELRKYLYRENNSDVKDLQKYLHILLDFLMNDPRYKYRFPDFNNIDHPCVKFVASGHTYDLIDEKMI